MKKLQTVVSALVIATLVFVIPATAFAKGKTHDMTAEIVSIDEKAKTITIKDDKGENHTAPLLGTAVSEAKSLKAGDKVSVTCQDNEKGDHEGITAIKKVTS